MTNPFREASYDLAVVGAGAAGLAAAATGVRRGARTVLVESARPGGDCTWTGCVPSKTLLDAAARGEDFSGAMARVRQTVHRIAATEDVATLRGQGIDVIEGRARFAAADKLEVAGELVKAEAVVIATGAGPALPPIEGLDQVECLTTDTVFDLGEPPESVAVLGGGPVGCELAQAFARLGVSVSLVEARDRLLPTEEPEASEVVADALRHDGVEVHRGEAATKAEAGEGGVRLHRADGTVLEAASLLVVAGRRPHTADLGLDTVGVEVDGEGHVVVDDRMCTSVDGVFAAGDVTGLMPFTHAADEMGRIAASNALDRRPRRRFRTDAVPLVIFTDPEVARVGVVEADAPRGARVAELPFTEVDRAVVTGREEGFVKLVAAPRRFLRNLGGGRLVGATVVGPRAGEMIHEAALGVQTAMFTGRLAETVHAYPTWSMGVRKAAAQFFQPVGNHEARRARRR